MRAVILVERVGDALVENLFWILRSMWTLWPRFRIRKTEISQERAEIVQVVLDIEFFGEKVLNLL